MHKQEIKEGEKLIEELINNKIRGGKDNEMSEIAENALKIEIKPNLSFTSHKKASFSIILPISENQKKILDDQRQENKNKAIFLTIPYVILTITHKYKVREQVAILLLDQRDVSILSK